MKKIVQILVAACLLLISQLAFAAEYVDIPEGVDLTEINSFVMGKPLYTPKNGDPTMQELEKVLVEGLDVDGYKVVPYDDVAMDLLRHKNVDIYKMDRRNAAQVFAKNTVGVADTYVIVTVARNSRTIFFFEVFKAGTDELLFTYQVQAEMSNTAEHYKEIARDFYRQFSYAQRDQMKKRTKELLDGKMNKKGNDSYHKGRNDFKITDNRKK